MPKIVLGRPATYDDIIAAPDPLVAELIGDELWMSPRPGPRHAFAHGALFAKVRNMFGELPPEKDRWLIIHEPELHLGPHVLVPDIAGWRRERMTHLPETAYFPTAPDWVCEVLSHSTEALDRSGKLPIYAGCGVDHAWLVDPLVRTLEVLRLEGGGCRLAATFAGNVTVNVEPFTALTIDLAALWEGDIEAGGSWDMSRAGE